MGKSKIKQSAQYAYKDKKLKGKPGAGSMFIQLKSLKSLLGLKNGGDTMLKGDQVKLDKNKDGKISGEDFKMMKATKGKLAEEDKYAKQVREMKLDAKKGKGTSRLSKDIKKNNMGGEMKSTQGYGAARTSGMGLQDESLPLDKSLDYYKDIM